MAYTPPNVYYASVFDGTYTKLDGVQSVNINRGKQRFQDPTPVSTCSIELIPQSTFPSMTIGQFIDIRDTNSGSSPAYFAGKITDIQRKYAIPYNSSTGSAPADRVIITVTGGTGVLASGYGSISPGTTTDASYSIMIGSMLVAGVYAITPANTGWVYTGAANQVLINQNVINPDTAPWLDTINKIINTIQYSVDDLDMNRTFQSNGIANTIYAGAYFYPIGQTSKNISLVDDGSTSSTTYKYSQVDYVSSVQSSFTQVIIQSSFGDLNVTSGNAPYIGFTYGTAAASTTQTNALGNYVLTVNNSSSPVPFTMGTNTAVQANVSDLGKLANCPLGTAVTVKFRGTTVSATVSGITANYYPDQANILFNLTPSLGTPFTLNSSAFGVLNTNRLGYP